MPNEQISGFQCQIKKIHPLSPWNNLCFSARIKVLQNAPVPMVKKSLSSHTQHLTRPEQYKILYMHLHHTKYTHLHTQAEKLPSHNWLSIYANNLHKTTQSQTTTKRNSKKKIRVQNKICIGQSSKFQLVPQSFSQVYFPWIFPQKVQVFQYPLLQV